MSNKKAALHQSIGDLDEDEGGGATTQGGDLTPNESGAPKYFSMIEDGQEVGGTGKSVNPMLMMMNMASIDSNSEFQSVTASASNAINNKNNRKLKRIQ